MTQDHECQPDICLTGLEHDRESRALEHQRMSYDGSWEEYLNGMLWNCKEWYGMVKNGKEW